ncbi:MAG: amidohydrolase family protein [Acidobacteriota bacterium]
MASAVTATQVTLIWIDESDNETSFAIDRSANVTPRNFTPIGSVFTPTETYTDNNLQLNTVYYYQVRALNGAISSAASAEVMVQTLSGQKPPIYKTLSTISSHTYAYQLYLSYNFSVYLKNLSKYNLIRFMWDLIIKHVEIVDGSGLPAYVADIAIIGEHIVAIGKDLGIAETIIDAKGLTAIPGIIDPHSHADLIVTLPFEQQRELLRGKLFQGVTTMMIGNCGLGAAPVTNDSAETILRGVNAWMTPMSVPWNWRTIADYLDQLEQCSLPVNIGMLIPHGPVRISTMGLSKAIPSRTQLRRMCALVREGLAAGAYGLSTGLIYPPGMYSAPEELIALAAVVAEADAIYTSHIRGSSETLIDAVKELIAVGRKTGAHVHHSHNEAVGQSHWSNIDKVLTLEEAAVIEGVGISFDMFPYTAAATMMVAIYPPWALEGGIAALIERLRTPSQRARIQHDVENTRSRWRSWAGRGWPHNLVRAVGWEKIVIGYLASRANKQYENLTLAEFAQLRNQQPFDAISDLIIAEEGRVSMLIHEISGESKQDELLMKYICHPLSAFCSDAEDYGHGRPHPAAYGAFARIFHHFVERRKAISFEAAVRKMTSYPAQLFGIRDRGLIRVGMYADLVLLDRTKIRDRATFASPRRTALGVEYLLLNGRIALKHGNYLQQPGRLLRRRS